MGALKSRADVGNYVDLVRSLIRENPLETSSLMNMRDLSYVSRRYQKEGLSFLTVTLPSLWKAVQLGLETGLFVRPRAFSAEGPGSVRPSFLGRYFRRIFDVDGRVLEDSCPRAVSHIYQVCYLLYKLETGYTAQQEEAVVSKFVETESQLDFEITDQVEGVLSLASHLTESVFRGFDPHEITPRHGPGAVATGEKQEEKWSFKRLYYRLHQQYDYLTYFGLKGVDTLEESLDAICDMEFLMTGTAKVVLVPKDSRGPRLISCEPLEYQYIQQGLGRKLMSFLEEHPWTKGHINFTDQSINRELALTSSHKDGEYATLDLEAASDRVSLVLVEIIFERVPVLLECLKATRTTATTLPDGQVLPLGKFAPMGSALCFPVEAYVFWVLAVAAQMRKHRRPLNEVLPHVYVYGDDILVHRVEAGVTIEALEQVALKVNATKSCVDGEFRESCGMDAFKRQEVTPVKLHRLFSADRDPNVLAAYASAANQLSQRGYERAANLIWSWLRVSWGEIPWGTDQSPFVCRYAPSERVAETRNKSHLFYRWSHKLQRLEFLVHTALRDGKRETTLDGRQRLMRDLISPPLDPGREAISDSIKYRKTWLPVSVSLTQSERMVLGR